MMTKEIATLLTETETHLRKKILQDYEKLREKARLFNGPESVKEVTLGWFGEHFLNLDFFTLVPEARYGERISESSPQGPPASTRDNLEHMIANLEDRLGGWRLVNISGVNRIRFSKILLKHNYRKD